MAEIEVRGVRFILTFKTVKFVQVYAELTRRHVEVEFVPATSGDVSRNPS